MFLQFWILSLAACSPCEVKGLGLPAKHLKASEQYMGDCISRMEAVQKPSLCIPRHRWKMFLFSKWKIVVSACAFMRVRHASVLFLKEKLPGNCLQGPCCSAPWHLLFLYYYYYYHLFPVESLLKCWLWELKSSFLGWKTLCGFEPRVINWDLFNR